MNYNAYAFSKRNKIIEEGGNDTYADFLKSETWKKIRQLYLKKRLKRVFWQHCQGCARTEGLQLHHMRYKKINLTRVTLNNIMPLCGVCHKKVHDYSRLHNTSFITALRHIKQTQKPPRG